MHAASQHNEMGAMTGMLRSQHSQIIQPATQRAKPLASILQKPDWRAAPPTETAKDERDSSPMTPSHNDQTGEQTWRPAQEGDLVLRENVERIGEGLIDSSQFHCES